MRGLEAPGSAPAGSGSSNGAVIVNSRSAYEYVVCTNAFSMILLSIKDFIVKQCKEYSEGEGYYM
jgi:hypothetical protein